MGWQNRENSRVRDAEPRAQYPWIQWVNRGNDLDPRHKTGGFFITAQNLDLLGNPEIEGGESCNLVFSSEESETGAYLPSITIAVLGTRFAWRTKVDNRTILSPEYTPGSRGKLQTMVLLKTSDGFAGPLLVTLTGTITKDMGQAIKQHRATVQKATSGNGAASWFLMSLSAGTPERRGSGNAQSMVTPILNTTGDTLDPDMAYIGDEKADWLEETFDTIERWQREWETSAIDPSAADPELQEDPYAPADHQNRQRISGTPPLAQARTEWSKQWNRCKKCGFTPPFMDNGWSIDQIQRATVFMSQTAEALEHGATPEDVKQELAGKLETL